METISSILHYFFTSIPGKDFAYYNYFYAVIALLIIGSIIFSQTYKKKKKNDLAFKKLFKNVSNRLMTFGIIFGLLVLLRYEQIPYFSMRALLYLTGGLFIYWSYKTIKTYKTTYLKAKKDQEKKSNAKDEKKKVKTYSASKKKK